MKVLIAIDSFKGSVTSLEAGLSVAKGIKLVDKSIKTQVSMLADGGEGTLETLISSNKGSIIHKKVHGPINKVIDSTYGYIKKDKLAIIEMSKCSGITLLKKDELNPLKTTTYGVGELIIDAINKGCKNFIICIGGSATNDGGVGMLMALGYKFMNKNHKPISLGAIGLKDLDYIDVSKVDKRVSKCNFLVASDVSNPLCGPLGCSVVFGPQKGASKEMIKDMDKWLHRYADITKKTINKDYINHKGAGAAGGLGYALITYLNATLKPGIEIVLDKINLEKKIKDVDVVVTGEGRLDAQTAMGKAPIGVAKLAKKYNKLVIAFGGCLKEDVRVINKHGIDAYFSIIPRALSINECMDINNTKNNLKNTAEQVFRLIYRSHK